MEQELLHNKINTAKDAWLEPILEKGFIPENGEILAFSDGFKAAYALAKSELSAQLIEHIKQQRFIYEVQSRQEADEAIKNIAYLTALELTEIISGLEKFNPKSEDAEKIKELRTSLLEIAQFSDVGNDMLAVIKMKAIASDALNIN